MRSVADQSVQELGGTLSVLTRQKTDHIELNLLLEKLQAAAGGHQQRVLLRIYRLVFPHAFAEESILWPLMRRVLPEGEELTLEVEREHQEVNELVTRLEEMDPSSPERSAILARLVEVLREDVRDEEDQLLPRLQALVSRRRLRRLGLLWEIVRRIAPTRAHPVVARRPPGNVIAALPLSVLDRLRDAVDALRYTGGRSDGRLLGAVSGSLTRAAHAVEHLPLMRRGEDPSTRVADPSPRVPWGLVTGAVIAGSVLMLRRGGPR